MRGLLGMSGALRAVFAAVLGACVSLGGAAWAQFDVGFGGAGFLNGEKVAEIYIPPREAGACSYKEYWYLFENYPNPYPGSSNPLQMVITMVPQAEIPKYAKTYKSFLRNMKRKHPGGYMIVMTARELRPECR